MDSNNPVIKLCQQGAVDEYRNNKEDACNKYHQAWSLAQSDYESCIAAHYVARCQQTAQEELKWNLAALEYAKKCDTEMIVPFLGSLYVNIGYSYEKLGETKYTKAYYQLTAQHGVIHKPD
jgi:hypothetical protein